ncbi:response regulator receiver sensor signal transduction histidine kinase [Leptolyngbya sp. Heron Island J]|uniref:hybrid sensor histidine kinase/response regulator n=1 Tax=Leptolyngbya sp. Heron Island J TaxID=1385935 RepID=UPI0003B96384|nr:hybrid sensor histidine kinase/response regulator [Leptolyngbya sp. Heron Island J]ESA36414.1 response regulator receiver sensor signal transduction histidine kinase [Leptolyngbya sp. Heron Island J]
MNTASVLLGQVAVVDDTPANLHLLSNLLEDAGYDVRPFPTGAIALAGITYSLPDLILLDIQMPGMNGYELCQELKAQPSTQAIPVIFISALNETFDKVKAFQVGGVDYIPKPFQAEEVLARVATHLELYQMKRQLQKANSIQAEQLVAQNAELLHLNQSLEQANQELQLNYEQLIQTQLQLVKTEKMATLGGLVAGVAHELNNPIGFISGNVAELQLNFGDIFEHLRLYQSQASTPSIDHHAQQIDLPYLLEDIPKMLTSMETGCDRIHTISTSLRTFSRADKATKIAFNFHEGIDSTLLILKHRLKANDQRPAIQVHKQYGPVSEIQCFPGQLNQVFMNILANAIDVFDEAAELFSFTDLEYKSQTITIQTIAVPEEQSVEIRIGDNGKGMSDYIKAKIFDQLFTTKPLGKGTGLGLAIAHQIVTEIHDGSLTVDSKVDQGTEFCIRLPL